MPTESRREVAERIAAKSFLDSTCQQKPWHEYRDELADAIEAALKDRDERAAKIVELAATCEEIAAAIRNEDINA